MECAGPPALWRPNFKGRELVSDGDHSRKPFLVRVRVFGCLVTYRACESGGGPPQYKTLARSRGGTEFCVSDCLTADAASGRGWNLFRVWFLQYVASMAFGAEACRLQVGSTLHNVFKISLEIRAVCTSLDANFVFSRAFHQKSPMNPLGMQKA